MDMTTHDYIISGGQQGKSRLDVLSRVLYPSTRALLEAQGVSEGMSLLDLGCGGGNVSLMAAHMVGSNGQVTGVDFDETILELARQDASQAGTLNVTYSCSSAYDILWNDTFDIAYSRFLLSHLQRPADVLHRMIDAVKPGGRVVVEDIYFSAHFCYPACSVFTDYVRLFSQAARHNGQNADVGPSLYSLFVEAGLTDAGLDVILPTFADGEGKLLAWLTLDRIKGTLVEQGLATSGEIGSMLRELEEFTNNKATIISMPAIFRVWGTKR